MSDDRTMLTEVATGDVLGVGVGVSGLVEQGDQAVVHAQTLGWDAVPLERMLRDGTDLPLHLDNGAKTWAQAEPWFGAGRGARHAAFALVGSGVGAAIVADGQSYRGASSSAGEWGHTTLVYGGRDCRCGARGCLEAYIGAESIIARAAEAGVRVEGPDEETQLACVLADPAAAPVSPAAKPVSPAPATPAAADAASAGAAAAGAAAGVSDTAAQPAGETGSDSGHGSGVAPGTESGIGSESES